MFGAGDAQCADLLRRRAATAIHNPNPPSVTCSAFNRGSDRVTVGDPKGSFAARRERSGTHHDGVAATQRAKMPSGGPAANLRLTGRIVPPNNVDGIAWAVEAAVSRAPSTPLFQDSAGSPRGVNGGECLTWPAPPDRTVTCTVRLHRRLRGKRRIGPSRRSEPSTHLPAPRAVMWPAEPAGPRRLCSLSRVLHRAAGARTCPR